MFHTNVHLEDAISIN